MRKIYIKWIDSCGCTNRWEEISNEYQCIEAETIGFVIFNNDKVIAVANSVVEETPPHTPAQANGVMTIPWVSVIEHKYLDYE